MKYKVLKDLWVPYNENGGYGVKHYLSGEQLPQGQSDRYNDFYLKFLIKDGYIEPIKEEKKFGGIERASSLNKISFIRADGDIAIDLDYASSSDSLYNYGNYFHTYEEAYKRAAWIKAALKIWRWVEDANASVLGDGINWFYPKYSDLRGKFEIGSYASTCSPFKLKTEELCDQLIAELGPELRIFFRIKS
jgi:hypothetical protein